MNNPFAHRLETRYSSSGRPYYYYRREMRIWDRRRLSIVYLYPSVDSAEASEKAGGTGFVIAIQAAVPKRQFMYVVTNAHLIHKGACVLRINTLGGGHKIIETVPSSWLPHPDGDDVTVLPLTGMDEVPHDITAVDSSMLLAKQEVEELDIGIGDNVLLIGRFVHHEGETRNTPAARFGNIAMMNDEPIYSEARGHRQESFLVEMRSINGYSGSPAFVCKPLNMPSFLDVSREDGVLQPVVSFNRTYWDRLLGIDWGHLKTRQYVENAPGWITSNSAMTAVVPAWKIRELLDIEPLVKRREQINKGLLEQNRPHEGGAEMDSALPLPGSGFTPGLQRTIKDKLDRGEIDAVDEDAFLGSMRRAVPPETPSEPDSEAP